VTSTHHEAIVTLFRNRPTLAVELLEGAPEGGGSEPAELQVLEADLTQLVPTEHRADLVVAKGAAAAVVVEVQLARDEDKPFVWPLYQAALRARLRVPVCVLVVTLDEGVARWAARSVATGQPGVGFAPVVFGPGAVPWLTPLEAALRPEAAVLAVLAHRDDEGAPEVACAAIQGASWIDPERAWLYHDLVTAHLDALARARLEALMGRTYVHYPLSDFGKKWFGEGEAVGRAEGKAEGEVEGKVEAKAEAVLQVLAARGLTPTTAQRERVLACRDLATLDRWLWQAVTAVSVDQALG